MAIGHSDITMIWPWILYKLPFACTLHYPEGKLGHSCAALNQWELVDCEHSVSWEHFLVGNRTTSIFVSKPSALVMPRGLPCHENVCGVFKEQDPCSVREMEAYRKELTFPSKHPNSLPNGVSERHLTEVSLPEKWRHHILCETDDLRFRHSWFRKMSLGHLIG